MLSGGECNRLLLAKLFSLPKNLLVLDEPTNDLDIESLELLENLLVDYKGTLLLVSHDRTFVDAVATSTLVFSGEGKITEYIGGYDAIPHTPTPKKTPALTRNKEPKKNSVMQLGSKMKKELEALPQKIATCEALVNTLKAEMSTPVFYNNEQDYITKIIAEHKKSEDALEQLYKRWEDLETLKNSGP